MIFNSRDVITIGSATFDAFLKTNLPLIFSESSPTKKAFYLDFGSKLHCDDAFFSVGGNAMNAAVTFSRQGLEVAPMIVLGDDEAADLVLSRIAEEGIDSGLVSFTDKRSTSFSTVILQAGERTLLNYKGAGEFLEIPDFSSALRASWWYVSLPGKSYKYFPKVVEMARKNGIKLAFNPTLYHINEGKQAILKNLKYIDFFVVNTEEAAVLTDTRVSDRDAAFERLNKLSKGIIAITAGSDGSVISDGERIYKVPIFKTKKFVDRTGAGDAFASGFVSGLLHKKEKCVRGKIRSENIMYAAKLASANAVSVVEGIGASVSALHKHGVNASRFDNLKITVKENKKTNKK